jgi:TM2 domain-containing membrane protein YozV
MKSKSSAGILALLLGGIGAHKFYLGRTGQGLLYLLFFWTFIPAVIAFIEGIVYLTMSEADFNAKYNTGLTGAQAQPQNIVVNVANTASSGTKDVVAKLKELHELKIAGVITDSEFEAQKGRLLQA